VDPAGKLQLRSGQRIAVLDQPADVTLDLPSDIVAVDSAGDADALDAVWSALRFRPGSP
jgi:hypothetical protein